MKEESRLSKLQKKLEFFINEVDETWTSTQYNGKWVFKPIWISRYADLYLWKHTKRVLGMSATILNPMQMCINVGIKGNDYAYNQLPSPFPNENRPIYYTPAGSVTHKNMSVALPQITKRVKEILSQHSDDKILIHVVSYKIKDHLMKNIHSDRLMEHSSFDRAEVLEAFKRSKYPKVLVSPSYGQGCRSSIRSVQSSSNC
jgi:Rad3-related DNA helicase